MAIVILLLSRFRAPPPPSHDDDPFFIAAVVAIEDAVGRETEEKKENVGKKENVAQDANTHRLVFEPGKLGVDAVPTDSWTAARAESDIVRRKGTYGCVESRPEYAAVR